MFIRHRTAVLVVVLAAALLGVDPAVVGAQTPIPVDKRFTKSEAMIAMRDGVKLYTTGFTPKEAKGPLPFILLRTR